MTSVLASTFSGLTPALTPVLIFSVAFVRMAGLRLWPSRGSTATPTNSGPTPQSAPIDLARPRATRLHGRPSRDQPGRRAVIDCLSMPTRDRNPTGGRAQRGLAAIAVATFAAAAGLLAHGSCAPTGDTRTPDQRRQPDNKTPDPDPATVDLSPNYERQRPMT